MAVPAALRLDDHRVQRPDDQVDGERGRQQRGSRRMAGTEPQHGRKGPQQADGYLRAGAVSPLYGGRMFACNTSNGTAFKDTANVTDARRQLPRVLGVARVSGATCRRSDTYNTCTSREATIVTANFYSSRDTRESPYSFSVSANRSTRYTLIRGAFKRF